MQAAITTVVRDGARWLTLERDDAARLLALESFLAAAKSRDLEDAGGRPLDDREVTSWVAQSLRVADWPLVVALAGDPPSNDEERPATSEIDLEIDPEISDTAEPPRVADDVAATIRACLGHLRIASLERLMREVTRSRPEATRTEIVTALEAMPDHVRWFGRAIVAVQEGR